MIRCASNRYDAQSTRQWCEAILSRRNPCTKSPSAAKTAQPKVRTFLSHEHNRVKFGHFNPLDSDRIETCASGKPPFFICRLMRDGNHFGVCAIIRISKSKSGISIIRMSKLKKAGSLSLLTYLHPMYRVQTTSHSNPDVCFQQWSYTIQTQYTRHNPEQRSE